MIFSFLAWLCLAVIWLINLPVMLIIWTFELIFGVAKPRPKPRPARFKAVVTGEIERKK